MKNSNKTPEIGNIVKVYYEQKKTYTGTFIPNSEFGIVVKVPVGDEKICLRQSYEKYELQDIDFFLENTQIRFV